MWTAKVDPASYDGTITRVDHRQHARLPQHLKPHIGARTTKDPNRLAALSRVLNIENPSRLPKRGPKSARAKLRARQPGERLPS
jgi:hypothetical protein